MDNLTRQALEIGRANAEEVISFRKNARKAEAGSAGILVAEGDSWFNYPWTDILRLLEDEHGYEVESVAHYGDTVEQMAYSGEEGRRFRAWELAQQGWKQCRIAAALGVTEGAISQWLKRAREGGVTALSNRPRPGRVPRLSPEEQLRAPGLLGRGAEAFGFVGERWTRERVAAVIWREFGVRYHPAHISRLLRRWGFSLQKPARRARQRDEAAIRQFRDGTYPVLEKRGHKKASR